MPGSGYLSLVNRETGDSASLGSLDARPYSLQRVPGTSRVVHDPSAGGLAPPNNLSQGTDLRPTDRP